MPEIDGFVTMPRPKPKEQMAAIVAALEKRNDSATFLEVAVALNPPAPMRNVQRWLHQLVQQKRVIQEGTTRAARYRRCDPVPSEPPLFGSPVGQAIHRLVTQPYAERTPTEYHRVVLERYRPNETYLLPAEIRARIRGNAGAGAWWEKPVFDRLLADFVSRILWLEDVMTAPTADAIGASGRRLGAPGSLLQPRPAKPLTDAEIVGWLAQRQALGARRDVQLLWNIRAALIGLVNRNPKAIMSRDLIIELYGQVTNRMTDGPWLQRRTVETLTTKNPAIPALLRTSPLELPGSVYRPPADAWTIETCFNDVLRLAGSIADPVEQSFFLLTHLFYLQPFGMVNATMALLTMNVPLVGAGLAPMTFSAVQHGDLLAGIRGVWELNRTELLCDAFMRGL